MLKNMIIRRESPQSPSLQGRGESWVTSSSASDHSWPGLILTNCFCFLRLWSPCFPLSHLLFISFKNQEFWLSCCWAIHYYTLFIFCKLCCRWHLRCVGQDDHGCLGYLSGAWRLFLLNPQAFPLGLHGKLMGWATLMSEGQNSSSYYANSTILCTWVCLISWSCANNWLF